MTSVFIARTQLNRSVKRSFDVAARPPAATLFEGVLGLVLFIILTAWEDVNNSKCHKIYSG